MIDELVVPGLDRYENDLLNQNLQQLGSTVRINKTRKNYLEAKQNIKKMGIAIPPSLSGFETVMGWPYKSVKSLSTRIKLTGFALPGEDLERYDIHKIWAENRLAVESSQAHQTALTYGVSFLAAMQGDETKGEPPAIIRNLSPLTTTALWSKNLRRATSGVTIINNDGEYPTELIFFMEDAVLTLTYRNGRWLIDDAPTLGHCPLHVLAYDSSTEYPFGRSRITQGVMGMTDEAIRTALRMEVSAEFFSAPQRYLLGADEEAFVGADGTVKSGWEAIIGRMLAIPANEDGENPEVGQFAQHSFSPHSEHFRLIAAKFSGETNIPVNALGIIHDNPASDAAMHTAYLDLNADAESAHDPFGYGWVGSMRDAVEIRGTGTAEELELLSSKWRDPATPTKSSASQAAVALVTAGILPADSDVALEMVGFDQVTIDRIIEHRKRSGATNRLTAALAAAAGAANADATGPGVPPEQQNPGRPGTP
jgi:hypothetical protein